MFKNFSVLLLLAVVGLSSQAAQYVHGYTKSNGTYVQPHYKTSPNATTYDNYSTKGNYNPYTGEKGTKNPYQNYNNNNNNNNYNYNSRKYGY